MYRISCWLLVTATFGLSACKPSQAPMLEEGGDETETGDEDEGDDGVGDSDSGDTDDPGGFIIPDHEGVKDCDPWMQDCPEGEKCVPWASAGGNWDANKCVPINGDGLPGDTCTYDGIVPATDSCGADSHCWDVMDVDGQLQGVCTSFCEGSPDDPLCGPSTSCLIANESINLCVRTCDPLAQDCDEGLGCFWANSDFQCIFTAGEILTGEPCGFINDCAPGLLCTTADVLPDCNGSSCCTPYCDLADPVCGDPDTECSAFFEEGTAPPGYEDVGVCILVGA